MSGQSTEEIFMALFGAFSEQDHDAARALLADDVVWHFPGVEGQLAGTHQGPDAVMAFLAQVRELTNETFEISLDKLVIQNDMVVVLFEGTAQRGGRDLTNPTCLVLRFGDGKLQQAREFVWDLAHVEQFWK